MKITVQPFEGGYRLMATHPNMGHTTPAGPRLLRLAPPQIKFLHAESAGAFRDAAKLQLHIDESPSLKLKKRKDLD